MIKYLEKLLGLTGKRVERPAPLSLDPHETALAGLRSFLSQAKPGEEYTFEYLVHRIDPSSPEDLAAALALLVQEGILEQVLRVESPETHGGIGDYHTIQEIPDELPDWRTGEMIAVRPEYLRVLYVPTWTNSHSQRLALRQA